MGSEELRDSATGGLKNRFIDGVAGGVKSSLCSASLLDERDNVRWQLLSSVRLRDPGGIDIVCRANVKFNFFDYSINFIWSAQWVFMGTNFVCYSIPE